jgi:hypothetical protein
MLTLLPNVGEQSPAQLSANYFQDLYHRFEQAANQAGGVQKRYYQLGTHVICFAFAGERLLALLTPALAHMQTEPRQPDFTFCLWDSASTGVMTPPPPWRHDPNAYGALGEIQGGYNTPTIKVAFNMFYDCLSMLNAEAQTAIYWVRDADLIPYWETAAPVRTLFHWWATTYGYKMIHGAVVGTPEAGIMLVGKGGSGKSTTSLVCLQAEELVYVGDDYCMVATEPDCRAYSMYSSAKLKPDNTHRLGHLETLIANRDKLDTEKAYILLHQHFPEKLALTLPVKAIVVPQVTGLPDTQIAKASPAEALIALAPSTLFQMPGASRDGFQQLAQVVKQLPCYKLLLGTDLSQIPPAILQILSLA